MRRRTLLAGTGTALAAGSAGCLSLFTTTVEESFEERFEVSDETVLTVSNRNGEVTVEGTDDDQLTVAGEKQAGSDEALADIDVNIREGEQFVVEVDFSAGSEFERRRVDLTIDVPGGVTVDRVETANGEVTVEGVGGDVRATTSNGNVEVNGVDGYVDCETSNGDVDVRDTAGLAGAATSNGEVDVDLLAMDDDVTCRSSNGSVVVRVGPDVAVAFELSTSNGRASVEDLEHTTSTSRRGYVEGRLRGGTDPTLTVESTNGNVTLRALEA